MNETQRLTEQNQLRGWLDCEARGKRHKLDRPLQVRSAYGQPWYDEPSTVRQCRRCPVRVFTRGR